MSLSERIIGSNQGLLAEMVQLKYTAMSENAFRFFRGTCELFYQDLKLFKQLPASPLAWICGDLHVENFGSYKADNDQVYFDLNDFDEALLAPVAFELVRMLTSIFLCFDFLELEEVKAMNMVQVFLKNYAVVLTTGKALAIEPRIAKGIVNTFLQAVCKRKQSRILEKRTEVRKRKVVISLKDERHFELEEEFKKELTGHLTDWIKLHNKSPYNYKVKDAVFRLAGTGSVGTKRFMFLLESELKRGKYLIIDMKQSQPSALIPFVKVKQPIWATESERVVFAQELCQHMPCALLSHTNFKGDSYVIKEMQPTEDKIKFRLIQDQYRDIYQVIDDMASLTAYSHLRSSGRKGSAIADELIEFGQQQDWQEQLIDYAFNYSKRVKKDYKIFKQGYESGIYSKGKITNTPFVVFSDK
ncbi:uncharacterized protein (DUF2252 family) [Pedobacter cryoconitis]|uniref:Uncharacterized protein (DUF2252 family) n=1 Tax=Pedobacter cryoconitis TaxID=188932 RepID=A0A7W8ZJW5_9SPHI|nr:DUF2252 family protein [Pedobacter cryoconitis]MBB5635128.1 uncharacterized protein (DUF2252 family) [Pedobacter cryoconitis]MBB6271688.1 uncharacterized protein (DUF2252 family) [Pedobacter cryoconitis]